MFKIYIFDLSLRCECVTISHLTPIQINVMFKLLQKKVGNYSLLEGVSIAVLLGIAFWISSELFEVRQEEYVLQKNADKTTLENTVSTVATN